MEKASYRSHGFSSAPNCYQLSSWLACALSTAASYALVFPNLPQRMHWSLLSFFSLALLATVFAYCKCAGIDPSDPSVKCMRSSQVFPSTALPAVFPGYCRKCSCAVQARSKHCRVCNRCTAEFDHHCFWLNNCVGRENYRWFIGLTIALETLVVTETVSAVEVVYEVLAGGVRDSSILQRYDFGDYGACFCCVLFTLVLLSCVLSVTIGFLLAFHMMLAAKHISTYEFILRKRLEDVRPAAYASTGQSGSMQVAASLASELEAPQKSRKMERKDIERQRNDGSVDMEGTTILQQ